jgi:hypothetical protein
VSHASLAGMLVCLATTWNPSSGSLGNPSRSKNRKKGTPPFPPPGEVSFFTFSGVWGKRWDQQKLWKYCFFSNRLTAAASQPLKTDRTYPQNVVELKPRLLHTLQVDETGLQAPRKFCDLAQARILIGKWTPS